MKHPIIKSLISNILEGVKQGYIDYVEAIGLIDDAYDKDNKNYIYTVESSATTSITTESAGNQQMYAVIDTQDIYDAADHHVGCSQSDDEDGLITAQRESFKWGVCWLQEALKKRYNIITYNN